MVSGHEIEAGLPVLSDSGPIHVLHVEDDAAFADMVATFLERERERFEVHTETRPEDALAAVESGTTAFDCVVSDYDMPGMNGLALLREIRDERPDLPFVLFTGKGSEEIASEAITAGVTDYLQKAGGTEQYCVLANRVSNAVEGYRAQQYVDRSIQAIETARDGISILDDEGRVVYANSAYASALGYEREELLGTHWESFYRDEDIYEVYDELLPEARRGHWRGTTTFVRNDGRYIETEHTLTYADDGSLICTLSPPTGEGTASRTRSVSEPDEDRFRTTAARLEALFEHSPDMIAVHDADGTIRDVNRRMCETLGYDEAELVGTSVWDLDTTVDPDHARSFWSDLPTNTPRRFEGRLERRDGTTFPVEVHLIRLDLDGDDRFVAVDRDITERKEREDDLLRQNERLDEFTRMVSHDLRNPLQVAQGRLALLDDECDSEHIEPIAGALDRMDALIADLLTLAREGEGAMELERVALESIARACWETVETADATLVVEAGSAVTADRVRLKQLLENLFRNSVEHGSTNNRSATDDALPDSDGDTSVTVTVGVLEDGFYVADDGPGIPEGERERVLEAGYSTASDGTGFGLKIVEQIADAHGWDVRLTESEQGGARVEITGVQDGSVDDERGE